jgi:hypothetical protein
VSNSSSAEIIIIGTSRRSESRSICSSTSAAVHLGHQDVEEHDVEGVAPADPLERLERRAVARGAIPRTLAWRTRMWRFVSLSSTRRIQFPWAAGVLGAQRPLWSAPRSANAVNGSFRAEPENVVYVLGTRRPAAVDDLDDEDPDLQVFLRAL